MCLNKYIYNTLYIYIYILYPTHGHNTIVTGCKQNHGVKWSYDDLIWDIKPFRSYIEITIYIVK